MFRKVFILIQIFLFLTLPYIYAQEVPDTPPQRKTYTFSKSLDRVSPYPALEPGSVQELLNMKRISPGVPFGWRMRSGTTRHNQVDSSGISSLHTYYNRDFDTYNFISQVNDTLELASAFPPSTSDTFGSSILTLQSGTSVAFSTTVGNDWIGAASGETPWAYSGTAYPDEVLIERYPSGGTLYQSGWYDVRNKDTSKKITWIHDSFGTGQTVYLGFRRRIDGAYFDVQSGNTTAAGTSVYARRSGGWVEPDDIIDGTASPATDTFGQDGTISWPYSALDEPYLLPGTTQHLFWYQFTLTANIPFSTTISEIRVTDDAQPMTQLWSGLWDLAIGAQRFTSSVTLEDFTQETTDGSQYSFMTINPFIDATSDSGTTRFYAGFANPVFGIYIQVDTDNINKVRSGTPTVNYWDATELRWNAVGAVEDGTAHVDASGVSYFGAHTGLLQWSGESVFEDTRILGGNPISMYWYEIELPFAMSSGVTVNIWELAGAQKPSTVPPVPEYTGVASYNGRAIFWPGEFYKNGLDLSMENKGWVLNGPQAGTTGGIFGPGIVNAFAQIHSYGIVSTKHPYRLYTLEGKTPGKWDELLISTKVGVVAPKTLLVIEDKIGLFNTARSVNAGIFLAPDGFYMTDAQTPINISLPIQDYFDTSSVPYIEPEFMDLSYGWIDYDEKTVHFAVPMNVGSTQSTLNYELVYNYLLGEWYDRHERYKPAACGIDLIGSDSKRYSYIGDYDGLVWKVDSGVSMDYASGISQVILTSEFNPLGELNYSFSTRKIAIKAKTDNENPDAYIYPLMWPDGSTSPTSPSGVTRISLTKSGFGYISQGKSAINLQGTISESLALQFMTGTSGYAEQMEIYGFTWWGQPIREGWE